MQVISEHAGWDSNKNKSGDEESTGSSETGSRARTGAAGMEQRSVPTTSAADFAALGALLGGSTSGGGFG